MNKTELEQRLINENIPVQFYSLHGGLPSEAWCLNERHGKWEVYYSERGVKTGLKTFDLEEDACDYFYDELIEVLREMRLI